MDQGNKWKNNFPCDDGYKYTAPVGSYRANAYGLNDMLGNVWEWTCSAYQKDYEGKEMLCDNSAQRLSMRGGSWINFPSWIRAANRYKDSRTARHGNVGFRLVQVN